MTSIKKIMIVEDDEYFSKVYEIKLSKEGFAVSVAKDGDEAIKKMIEEVPDVVLLDLMMPKKDGFEVLEDMKKNSKLSKVPVIVLSNLGQISDIERAKSLGADEFLIKIDNSIQDVIDKVHEYIKVSK